MWRATVLTIFPEMFPGPLGSSLAGKALATALWTLEAIDIRAHANDKHRSVDDTPAGGGPGMVMRADVLARAVDATVGAGDARPRLAMSPRGLPLTQSRVAALAKGAGAIILCGRFEGVDERLLEYPQYTRPQLWEGRSIPAVLTSGDHAKVDAWRRAEAERLTRARRPDLWAAHPAAAGKREKARTRRGKKPRRDG